MTQAQQDYRIKLDQLNDVQFEIYDNSVNEQQNNVPPSNQLETEQLPVKAPLDQESGKMHQLEMEDGQRESQLMTERGLLRTARKDVNEISCEHDELNPQQRSHGQIDPSDIGNVDFDQSSEPSS